jgi:hypothetical protein
MGGRERSLATQHSLACTGGAEGGGERCQGAVLFGRHVRAKKLGDRFNLDTQQELKGSQP